jgi:aspartate kinase
MSLKVLKFGGSSIGDAEALLRAAAIVRDELPAGGLVVVSALRGTTDSILEACTAAGQGDLVAAQAVLEALKSRHQEVARELGYLQEVRTEWDPLFGRLDQVLTGMAMLGEATPRGRDGALAIGVLAANSTRCVT